MNSEIERLHREIALAIYAVRPSTKWSKATFHFEGITLMSKGFCTFILENGSSFGASAGFDVNDAFDALRTEMAKLHERKQAWYTAKCEVTPDGKFTFNFDYDHLPAFDIIPSPGKWLDEFKHHPRPDLQEKIQDWIEGKVEPGEIVKRLVKLQHE